MAAARSKDIALLQDQLIAAGCPLRDHQLEGVEFMLKCGVNGHGCILADEMGLGKTCQAVVMLSHLCQSGRPHLILCPLSVIDHWQTELKRFGMNRLSVITYRGDKAERAELRDEIAQSNDWDILLTTYELFLKDHEILSTQKWKSLTVDEAHRLKNSASLLYQALGQHKFEWTLLLTGTPVQNNLTELYSLLMLIDGAQFPARDVDSFAKKYADSTDAKMVGRLRQILDRYLLRRTKDVVCPDLPTRSDIVLYHGISDAQKDLYKAILAKNHSYFEHGKGNTVSLNNVMMQLRKCVVHPYLFEGVEPEPFVEGEHLVDASGKLKVLDALLKHLHARKHKVLLFSQMTRALDILQDYLSFRGFTYERLDGSVRGEERFAAVKSFNEKTSDTFAFLLSTKAGGLGLTLTAADTVVFIDSDFNPQNDLQAAARAHRIGQDKPVKIIRLLARDTVEEIIQARATGKLKLTNAVIGASAAEADEGKLTAAEITAMITSGLNRLTTDEGNAEAPFLTDEMLIKILGGTDENGCWMAPKDDEGPKEEDGAAAEEGDGDGAQSSLDHVANMYFFEGKDYKADGVADQAALNSIIDKAKKTQVGSPRPNRRKTAGDDFDFAAESLAAIASKPRKVLTPEELEQRKKKREQNAALKKQREEEEQMLKEQQRRDRQRKKWAENDYESSNLSEPVATAEETDDADEIDLEEDNCEPFFVLGDVAHPRFRPEHEHMDALVLHCVDNSGTWGRGGVFDALLSRSPKVKEAYELAGTMGDLALGDAHLVGIDDVQSRAAGCRDSAALLVVQHRKSRDEMNTSALATSLSRVAELAREQKVSGREMTVHVPRIGYGMPKVQWYTIERLIKKHLCRRGVPVYIYYFDRRQRAGQQPRKRAAADADQDSLNGNTSSMSKMPALCSIFSDMMICLLAMSAEDYAKYKRLVFAFDGQVVDEVDISKASHVVVGEDDNGDVIERVRAAMAPNCVLVGKKWLDTCIKSRCLQPTDFYFHLLPIR